MCVGDDWINTLGVWAALIFDFDELDFTYQDAEASREVACPVSCAFAKACANVVAK